MAITVRTLLQIILENELKIDDEIDFGLDEDCEINGEYYELNFYNTQLHTIQCSPKKTFTFVFSLDRQLCLDRTNKEGAPTQKHLMALFDEMQATLKKMKDDESK